MNRILFVFGILLIFISATPGFSAIVPKIMTAENTLSMSENETKSEFRRFCFYETQAHLFENARQYLSKTHYGKDGWFGKADLEVYVPLLLKIETIKEEWGFKDNSLTLTLVLQAIVNPDAIVRRLKEIHADKALQEKMRADQEELEKKKGAYAASRLKQVEKKPEDILALKRERRALSREIDRLEEVKYLIAAKTKTAKEKISIGMTLDEVVAVAGQPRATATCEYPDFLNYGKIWIAMRNGIVSAKIPADQWNGACTRYNEPDQASAGKIKEKTEGVDAAETDKFKLYIKGGQVIPTPNYYQIDDIIYYKRFGGIIGIEAEKVEKIEAIKK